MAVNLTGIELSGSTLGTALKTATPQSASAESRDTASQQADVKITSTASLLAHLQASLARQPAIDQKRVDAISASLAEGTYKVDPGKVAAGLIQSERALGRLLPAKA